MTKKKRFSKFFFLFSVDSTLEIWVHHTILIDLVNLEFFISICILFNAVRIF